MINPSVNVGAFAYAKKIKEKTKGHFHMKIIITYLFAQ